MLSSSLMEVTGSMLRGGMMMALHVDSEIKYHRYEIKDDRFDIDKVEP